MRLAPTNRRFLSRRQSALECIYSNGSITDYGVDGNMREGLGDARLINSEMIQYLAVMGGHGNFYILWHLLHYGSSIS